MREAGRKDESDHGIRKRGDKGKGIRRFPRKQERNLQSEKAPGRMEGEGGGRGYDFLGTV